jgi:hypothetical protein
MLILGSVAAEPARFAFGGRERTYIIERPPGQTPRPTVIMLHGLNGTGADIARLTGLDRLAPQNGFVVLFPERIPQLQGWNFFPRGREPSLLIERTRASGGAPWNSSDAARDTRARSAAGRGLHRLPLARCEPGQGPGSKHGWVGTVSLAATFLFRSWTTKGETP